MSKHKLLSVKPRSEGSRRLQSLLLDYHHFRMARREDPLTPLVQRLEAWQGLRLRHTYQDLYQSAQHREALDFLIEDLYKPTRFTRRDDDLERIFPKIVKLIPEAALNTVSRLVELNLLTQELDTELTRQLVHHFPEQAQDVLEGVQPLREETYADCYRHSQRFDERRWQIRLGTEIGTELEKYVRSRFLSMGLGMTEGAARLAGLDQLHEFLTRGMRSFRNLGAVAPLLSTLAEREHTLLGRIEAGDRRPFELPQA